MGTHAYFAASLSLMPNEVVKEVRITIAVEDVEEPDALAKLPDHFKDAIKAKFSELLNQKLFPVTEEIREVDITAFVNSDKKEGKMTLTDAVLNIKRESERIKWQEFKKFANEYPELVNNHPMIKEVLENLQNTMKELVAHTKAKE
jgi:hypothetical protein